MSPPAPEALAATRYSPPPWDSAALRPLLSPGPLGPPSPAKTGHRSVLQAGAAFAWKSPLVLWPPACTPEAAAIDRMPARTRAFIDLDMTLNLICWVVIALRSV